MSVKGKISSPLSLCIWSLSFAISTAKRSPIIKIEHSEDLEDTTTSLGTLYSSMLFFYFIFWKERDSGIVCVTFITANSDIPQFSVFIILHVLGVLTKTIH